VQPGEVILTSGEDRIFPKGLLIGTVASSKPGYPFQTIQVQTAARLDRLEDVMVLLSEQPLNATAKDADSQVVVGLPAEPATTAPVTKPPAEPASANTTSAQPPATASKKPVSNDGKRP
jgi:rod shape-determining protein MreC